MLKINLYRFMELQFIELRIYFEFDEFRMGDVVVDCIDEHLIEHVILNVTFLLFCLYFFLVVDASWCKFSECG